MIPLTPSELATVLAALRMFQRNPDPTDPHFEDAPALSLDEIDELCERFCLGG